MLTHKHLLKIVRELPADYEPWGKVNRDTSERWLPDCSCGCKFYAILDGRLGADWGVCCNPESHRVGLLTFEHQGCAEYQSGRE